MLARIDLHIAEDGHLLELLVDGDVSGRGLLADEVARLGLVQPLVNCCEDGVASETFLEVESMGKLILLLLRHLDFAGLDSLLL